MRDREAINAARRVCLEAIDAIRFACLFGACGRGTARRDLGTAATYRDCFVGSAEHGVVEAPLALRLSAWAGLRNALLHLYLDSDHAIVHDALMSELSDVSAFAVRVRAWLIENS